MRTRVLILALALAWCCALAPARAERPVRQVLFDFEGGVEGWWGNVWGGGGKCQPELSRGAKFGRGALCCRVLGVERGSNTVSPTLAQDAPWRALTWGAISLWVKGDGSRATAKLTVQTGFSKGEQQTYSFPIPLDSTAWRKVYAPLFSFWNRYGVPFDPSRIRRLMFGCVGTHVFYVDQIALEAPQRPVPLEDGRGDVGAFSAELAQLEDGRYVLRLDPQRLPQEAAEVYGRVVFPDGVNQAQAAVEPAQPAEEPLLLLGRSAREGRAELSLEARGKGGAPLARARFGLDVVVAREPPEPTALGLLPAPKEVRLGAGALALRPGLVVRASAGRADPLPALNLLRDVLEPWLGGKLEVSLAQRGAGGPTEIALGAAPPALSPALAARLARLPAEGYVLVCHGRGARLAANDARGLVNAVCTALQAAESTYALRHTLALPAMEVVDWPNMAIRAVSLPLPTNRWGYPNNAPVDAQFFSDFLRETIVRHKLNMVVLIVQQAMRYKSHQRVSSPVAWPGDTVREIFDTLRSYAVEPVPCCNSLGHGNWLAIPYPELAEDGDVYQLCTANPKTKQILFDIYREIIETTKPRFFHIGMDEIRWRTYALPEEKRCPLCANKDKRDIFAAWVRTLHQFFAKQNIKVMMWGDMLVPEHNGGVPYHLAETIDRLPKEIIICNWSTGRAPLSSHYFRSHGYTVIKANSRGATLQEQRWARGNMVGIWGKLPWLVEGTFSKAKNYSYLSILEGAEFSWNFWPKLFYPSVPVRAEFFAARPLAQWRIAADPVPQAGAPEPVAAPGESGAEEERVRFFGLAFRLWPRPLSPKPGQRAQLRIGRRAAALYFLHSAKLASREQLVELLKKPENWRGVTIGSYIVEYSSGKRATLAIRYPLNVRTPQPGWCAAPLAFGALGVSPSSCAGEEHVYPVQWINPQPDDPIAKVALVANDAPARPVLRGLCVQPPAK